MFLVFKNLSCLSRGYVQNIRKRDSHPIGYPKQPPYIASSIFHLLPALIHRLETGNVILFRGISILNIVKVGTMLRKPQ